MGKETGISWTDHTFSLVWGCQEVSVGCQHCYARTLSTRWGFQVWGTEAPRRIMSDAYWRQPVAWNRAAQRDGRRHRVFTSSMADVFEDHPDVASQRPRLFTLIEQTPWLTWQLLTKRPENVLEMVPRHWRGGHLSSSVTEGAWPANAWLMTSAENQQQANLRLPWLLEVQGQTRVPVVGISAEPLLGPIDFGHLAQLEEPTTARLLRGTHRKEEAGRLAHRYAVLWDDLVTHIGAPPHAEDSVPVPEGLSRVGWVITGGESGPQHRPISVDWVRSVRDQCQEAHVPFFHKQWGGATPKINGKELDGREWCEFPDERKETDS